MAGVDGRRFSCGSPKLIAKSVIRHSGRWNNRIGGLCVGFAFSTRERTELSLRNTSHGSNIVSSTAVNGMSSIASDFVPQLVSSSPIIVALARVPGYVPSFPPVWDITLEHPPSNVIPLHIMNANNTFLIIINSSVDRGCWPDEL